QKQKPHRNQNLLAILAWCTLIHYSQRSNN
ncbi:hypothetical protein D018_1076B, partial [Vibrio parahaemolyticus VP2007-007]